MEKNIIYSIMIMSHNNLQLLQHCIDEVVIKTKLDYEFVIVDDASTEDYSKLDYKGIPHTIVRMPIRSNCCNLRNVGMEMSQGKFVFWVDNDTFVGDDWYKPLVEAMKDGVGLVGQEKDARLIRKPFLPLTQSDCMIEYEFVYDFNHENREADFITSYCVLVRKDAYRPTNCWDMPTPCLDPELGAVVKAMGYKVVVCPPINVSHIGSQTPRPNGKGYLYTLSKNFTKWWNFWEPYAPKIFELYKGIAVSYDQNWSEPNREASRGNHGDYDLDK